MRRMGDMRFVSEDRERCRKEQMRKLKEREELCARVRKRESCMTQRQS